MENRLLLSEVLLFDEVKGEGGREAEKGQLLMFGVTFSLKTLSSPPRRLFDVTEAVSTPSELLLPPSPPPPPVAPPPSTLTRPPSPSSSLVSIGA